LAFGLGYSSNVGPRAEASYRQALNFRGTLHFPVGGGIRYDSHVGYTDLVFAATSERSVDSLGLLAEHTDINECTPAGGRPV